MTIEIDMPIGVQNEYTKMIEQMLHKFESSEDKTESFAQMVQALQLGASFAIGSILEKDAREDLLKLFIKELVDCTAQCNRMHLMANSDIGIKVD